MLVIPFPDPADRAVIQLRREGVEQAHGRGLPILFRDGVNCDHAAITAACQGNTFWDLGSHSKISPTTDLPYYLSGQYFVSRPIRIPELSPFIIFNHMRVAPTASATFQGSAYIIEGDAADLSEIE